MHNISCYGRLHILGFIGMEPRSCAVNLDALQSHEFFRDLLEHTEKRKAGGFIVISGANSSLGSGKSSLACALYYALNNHWGTPCLPEKHCHMDAITYLDAWGEAKRKTALILDEANVFGLEASRHMSKESLTLGHMVQVQRIKQVWTITTCANWAHLTKRVRELANYNLVCTEVPGTVQAYKCIVSFDKGSTRRRRLGGSWRYPNTENTHAYKYLATLKDDYLQNFKDNYESTGKKGKTEKQIRRLAQGEVFHKMHHVLGLSYRRIGKAMGVTHTTITRIEEEYIEASGGGSKVPNNIYIP